MSGHWCQISGEHTEVIGHVSPALSPRLVHIVMVTGLLEAVMGFTPQHTNAFSVCVTFAIFQQSKASHMAKLRADVRGDYLRAWIQEGTSPWGLLMPIVFTSLQCFFLCLIVLPGS